MADPIHLKICGRCGTGIPETAPICPECGAEQERGAPSVDPFRGMTADFVRPWLAGHLGCLGWAALLVFGVPLLFGAALGNPLGGLALPLIGLSAAGLVGVGVLIWLVWPARPKNDGDLEA